MKRFVLDASVSLAWFLDEPVPPLAAKARRLLLHGSRGVVPGLWHLEMANALAVAERRGILASDDVEKSAAAIEQMLGKAIENAEMMVPLRQALTVARTFQLSAYDGVYLETARSEGIPLATLDKSLRGAALKAGVELLR
ncbi:MAG: type II toxin-antitoxin system VapC family toxin [Candidatus Acidiferrales bacterium]